MTSALLTRRIAILAFIGGLGGGLVFPILPALGLALGIPGFMIGLILSANRITRLIFNVPVGHLVGRLGPRLTLTTALGIESIGILGYSVALYSGHAAMWFLVGRVLFGIGTAFLFVGAQAVVLSLSDKADRGRKISSVRVAMSAAMPAGLVIGGVLADLFSDNVAFLTGAGITFAGAVYALSFLPRTSGRTNLEDQSHQKHGRLVSLFRASPARPFLFAAWGFNLLIFLSVQGVLLATLVLLIQQRRLYLFTMQAQGTSGLVMAIMIACSAVVAFYIGRVIDAVSLRVTLVLPALLILTTGFVTLAITQSSLPLLILGVVLIGISYNGVTLPMMALLGDVTTEEQHGPAVGLYQFFGDIGGTIGPIAGIEIVIHAGIETLYLAIATLIILAIPITLCLRGYEKRLWKSELNKT